MQKTAATGIREGDTYETDIGIHSNDHDVQEIPKPIIVQGDEPEIFFDFEATGFGNKAQIVQIAAISNTKEFDRYVLPTVPMTREASDVTQIEVKMAQSTTRGSQLKALVLKRH